jgi:hypothetical protein
VNSAGPPDPAFWNRLTGAIGPHNTKRLDYIGLDAFPDVFQPIPRENLPAAVTYLLRRFRTVTAGADIPEATPIHITETRLAHRRPADRERPGEAVQAEHRNAA